MFRFLTDDAGTTAVEYALLVGFMAALMIAGIQAVGQALDTMVKDVTSALF